MATTPLIEKERLKIDVSICHKDQEKQTYDTQKHHSA